MDSKEEFARRVTTLLEANPPSEQSWAEMATRMGINIEQMLILARMIADHVEGGGIEERESPFISAMHIALALEEDRPRGSIVYLRGMVDGVERTATALSGGIDEALRTVDASEAPLRESIPREEVIKLMEGMRDDAQRLARDVKATLAEGP